MTAAARGVALPSRSVVLRLEARAAALREISAQTIDCARVTGDPATLGAGLQALALAQILDGEVREALATVERVIEHFATLSKPALVFIMGRGRMGPPRPGDAALAADRLEMLFKLPREQASVAVLQVLLRASLRAATTAGAHEGAARLGEALERLQAGIPG